MEKETIKLYLNQITLTQMYKLFGIKEVRQMNELDSWLSNLPELTETEKIVANVYQSRLLENIQGWNEQELSLGFIGPIMNLIDFKVDYKIGFFAQRPISAVIGDYELIGKPDGIIASGHHEPETPFFSFQEYKKDINSSGDPAGQNLAAMLVGQTLNNSEEPLYGCYIVGRFWYFMILKGNEYIISRDYSASHDDIYDIIKILKKLRNTLFENLGITEKELVR
ncbi:MAG: hypothetical protein AB8G11_15450 [Saprospiraceae bacterium]